MDEAHRTTENIGLEQRFVLKNNQRLRCGYTTGTCAAAAAQAAVRMLLGQYPAKTAVLVTPDGTRLRLKVQECFFDEKRASCAVQKDGGDDPDATHGLLIFAEAVKKEVPGVQIDGGTGVGRVTRAGLDQPVGAAAINRVPRQMIMQEVRQVCEEFGYDGGISVVISVPGGAETAKKTFNPRLGIEGGISILGTSGIVVPMSEEALLASIRLEMEMKRAAGEKYLLITPGNYGEAFLRGGMKIDESLSMKCSNYVGRTIDMAVELGFPGILFVAHIGKFIKVSGGIMNTHSREADCRAELMASAALRAGADLATVRQILETITTEEAIDLLRAQNLQEAAVKELLPRIRASLQRRCAGSIETEVVLFSNKHGYLGETEGAGRLLAYFER